MGRSDTKTFRQKCDSVVKLEYDEQMMLLDLLKEKLPVTIRMYGMVKNITSRKWPYFEVFVDQWPDYNAVLTTPVPEKCDGFSGKFVLIHGNDVDTMLKILRHPGVLDWTKEYIFEVPPSLQPLLYTLLPEGSKLKEMHRGNLYVVDQSRMKFYFRIRLADIQSTVVKQEDTAFIIQYWNYIHPELHLFLTRLLNSGFPNVCLRVRNGQPVAYGVIHIDNSFSFLFVHPNFRHHGLAKVCVSHIAKALFKEEHFIAARINHDNQASRHLFMSCGFTSLGVDGNYVIMAYLPLESASPR